MRILQPGRSCHEMQSVCWSSSIVQAVNTLPFGDTRELPRRRQTAEYTGRIQVLQSWRQLLKANKLSSFLDNCCNLAVCTYQKTKFDCLVDLAAFATAMEGSFRQRIGGE